MHVSRETDQPDHATVQDWFGAATPLLYRYVDTLCIDAVRLGVIGPRETARIWNRHILNCVVVHPLLTRDSTVGDLGSGAGLPGVPLALARPDLSVTLIEPLLRRSNFLLDLVRMLAAPNLQVVRARGEDLAGKLSFDVVTARAVAPMDRLVEWALPLCRPGGELLALKGGGVDDELAAAVSTLERLHAGPPRVERCGVGVVEPSTTVVRIQSSKRPR